MQIRMQNVIDMYSTHLKKNNNVNKSVSMQSQNKIITKVLNSTATKHVKKTQSFLVTPKPIKSNGTNGTKTKIKTKKKQNNNSLTCHQPNKNFKNSLNLNKTTKSGNRSFKSNKTNKTKSNVTRARDYLIMNETIYQCENMEQMTQQLICGQAQFLTYGSYCKTVLRTMSKTKNYILGFKQYINYKKKTDLKLNNLTIEQKRKLYQLLTIQKEDNISSIDDIMKQAIKSVQIRTQQIIENDKQCLEEAMQWKSQKFNQLMVANNLLCNFSNLAYPSIQKNLQILIKQSSMDESQTSIQKNSFQYTHHNYNQKYVNFQQSLIQKRKSLQNGLIMMDTNIVGILKFMNQFFAYLYQNQHINLIIQRLHQRYGFNTQNKHKIYALCPSQWQFLQYQNQINIMSDNSFISFSKQLAQKIDDQDSQHIHIFHKAIFDCANQQMVKFQPQYPFGSPHPFDISQNLAFYIIDQDNFGCVWQELVKQITLYSNTLMGLQIQYQQSNKQFQLYEQKTFNTTIKKQIKNYKQDKIYSIAYGQMLFQISSIIQEHLLLQIISDIKKQ